MKNIQISCILYSFLPKESRYILHKVSIVNIFYNRCIIYIKEIF